MNLSKDFSVEMSAIRQKCGPIVGCQVSDTLITRTALQHFAEVNPPLVRQRILKCLQIEIEKSLIPKKRNRATKKAQTAMANGQCRLGDPTECEATMIELCREFHGQPFMTVTEWVKVAGKTILFPFTIGSDGVKYTKHGQKVTVGRLFKKHLNKCFSTKHGTFKFRAKNGSGNPLYGFTTK